MLDKDLFPMRWPEDPGWQKPEMLALVSQGGPVNCLIVPRDWPLREAAEKRNLHVITLSDDQLIPVANIKSGQTGIIAIKDAMWPAIASPQESGGGPTGNAWVNSNGWRIRLARAKAPAAAVWVDARPPKDKVIRPEQYALAVADAAAYGGRWIINLSPEMAKGIATQNEDAHRAGTDIVRAMRCFQDNGNWRDYQAIGKLAVVSDFEGPNEFFGTEVLNLAPRRQLPYRVFDKASTPDLKGIRAALWVDQKAPSAPWASALDAMTQSGGTLIVPASNAHLAKDLPPAGNFENRYNLFKKGSGRIAVARKPWADPYELASDVHLLLGRREDLVRLWNGSSTNLYCTELGGKCIVHVLNYAVRSSGSPLSFWIARQYQSARWHDLYSNEPRNLQLVHRNDGTEVALPDFLCYGAVELGEA